LWKKRLKDKENPRAASHHQKKKKVRQTTPPRFRFLQKKKKTQKISEVTRKKKRRPPSPKEEGRRDGAFRNSPRMEKEEISAFCKTYLPQSMPRPIRSSKRGEGREPGQSRFPQTGRFKTGNGQPNKRKGVDGGQPPLSLSVPRETQPWRGRETRRLCQNRENKGRIGRIVKNSSSP